MDQGQVLGVAGLRELFWGAADLQDLPPGSREIRRHPEVFFLHELNEPEFPPHDGGGGGGG